jgi:conserved hypothetical integral membrane protein
VTNALLAEFIGVKIFSLERTLGWPLLEWQLHSDLPALSFNLTAGVLLWPFVFILTDVINEYYGKRGVRFLSFLTAVLILYAYGMIWLAIRLEPADFWKISEPAFAPGEPLNMDRAFRAVLGQSNWIIVGSLVAFLIGQIVDVTVFSLLRNITGRKLIWVRATGSTLVSQLIDSFVVLFIAFYIGAGWSLGLVLGIGVINYLYKVSAAVLLTPLLYLLHGVIDRYLGRDTAEELSEQAADAARKQWI